MHCTFSGDIYTIKILQSSPVFGSIYNMHILWCRYKGAGVSALMPKPYGTQWAVCAKATTMQAERRALNAAIIVANNTRVVAVFSHIVTGTTTSNGVSACAYDTADGTEVWCTKKTKIHPPSATAISPVVSSHADGLVAVGVAGLGILTVDASAAAAPESMDLM